MREKLRGLDKHFSGRRVSPQELRHLQDSLLDESTLDRNYIVLIIGACIIATLGLLSNSAAVIIGAMLIAPLMLPIRGVSFGILEGELELVREGLKALGVGTAIAIALASLLALSLRFPEYGGEVLARSQPTLLDLGIAVTAGGISGFAKVEPKLSSTLAGTAIAVALMPPVCVVGLGVAQANWPLSLGALLLYLTNLIGITLACMLAFLLAGYSPLKRARRALEVTLAFTSLLVIPLGINLFNLVRQNQLETSLKQRLLRETITFQRLRLIDTETNWQVNPPEVRLRVDAHDPVSPKQVRLVEDFIAQKMGRPFRLIFEFSQVQEVTSDQPEKKNWQE